MSKQFIRLRIKICPYFVNKNVAKACRAPPTPMAWNCMLIRAIYCTFYEYYLAQGCKLIRFLMIIVNEIRKVNFIVSFVKKD